MASLSSWKNETSNKWNKKKNNRQGRFLDRLSLKHLLLLKWSYQMVKYIWISKSLVNRYIYMSCLVTQLCPVFCNPLNCSSPDSSGHGIFQGTILEWVALSSSTGSFPTYVSANNLIWLFPWCYPSIPQLFKFYQSADTWWHHLCLAPF